MNRRNSLYYKILTIFCVISTLPAVLVSLRLLYYNQALLIAGGDNWSVPPQAIEQIKSALIGQSLTYLIYSLIMVAIGAIFISGILMKPIRNLFELMESFTSRKSTAGYLPGSQSEVQSRSLIAQSSASTDELGILFISLRQAMGDISQLRQELETQVHERTQALEHRARQMQAAAAVAQDSASIRDLNQLLFKVTQLISENFGYYHVGIFLLDEKGEYAVLRAANSSGGQQMLVRGHKLNVAETSIVGHVANTRQPRVALSVGADAVHFRNPYLPETRSEMALPLVTGVRAVEMSASESQANMTPEQFSGSQRLWGVLDVQSQSEQAFSQEDIAVLQILANQVAIAIENAQLFIENQKALADLQNSLETSRKLYGEMTSDAWRKMLQARPETGYIASSGAANPSISDSSAVSLSSVVGEWPPDMLIASQSGQSMQSDAYTLILPIRMREMTAGVLRLRKAENAPPWSRSEIDLMSTITEQLGVALESARLYDETRRRAERERLTGEITARLRASNDPQVILQTAMEELRNALQISQARVIVQKIGDGAASE